MTDVFPMVVERAKNYASLFVRNAPGVRTYRLLAANSLDEAYVGQNGSPFNGVTATTGTEVLFDTPQDATFRSHTIRKNRRGLIDESTRGQTRMIFDPDDFFDPPTTTTVPPDKNLAFYRLQTATVASGGTFGTEGPILLFQSPSFAVVPRPAISLSGTAPNLATAAAGEIPPAESLEFRVPFYGDSLVFTNHSATDEIFLSVGRDIPFMQVDPGQNWTHTSGQKDSLVIAASGANPTFSLLISTVQGQR